jgi:chemotaxis protein MotA
MIFRFLGFIILSACLAVVYLFDQSNLATGAFRLLHWPAMILTGIGPAGLVMLSCSSYRVRLAIRLLFSRGESKRLRSQKSEADLLRKLQEEFYTKGIRAFSDTKLSELSPSIHRVVERLSLKISPQDVKALLESERRHQEAELDEALSVVSLGVRLAPSLGMLGTILGMVQLLASVTDPSKIGSHMSLALMTTFYGLFFSLMVWTPLQKKIEEIKDCESRRMQRAIQWLELIENRKPVQYFSEVIAVEGLAKRSSAHEISH